MSIAYTPTAARRIVTTLFIAERLGSAVLITNATVWRNAERARVS
jgi:hypothetical protein